MNLTELENSFKTAEENGLPAEILETIIPLANAYQQGRKYDSAVRCMRNALQRIRDDGDTCQQAVLLTALGTAFWEKAQLQKALDEFRPALDLFKESGEKMGERAILAMVGITFWRKCEWNRALEIFSDLLKEENEIAFDDRFLSLQGALERGVAILRNRVRMGRELQDPKKILQPLFSLTSIYLISGNLEELNSILSESISLADQLGQKEILDAAQGIRQLAFPT
ncbi:MAG: tetratricopeptide repeat protein [Nitrospinae bacterium]|nr:tetratricopeptide repeat protein [Nitrospinota bacterium]